MTVITKPAGSTALPGGDSSATSPFRLCADHIHLNPAGLGQNHVRRFDMIYAIVKDNGSLYPTVDVIDTYVFRSLRTIGNPAQAMAVGLYQSVVGFILVWGRTKS